MTKVIIINCNNRSITLADYTIKLINDLLEKEFKIVLVNKEKQTNFINTANIPFKNLTNLIELDINGFGECEPAISMLTVHNYGANLNYPSTIIDCIEKIFFYEKDFEYTYITFDYSYVNKYTKLLNDFFLNNGFIPTRIVDNKSLETELKNILKFPNDNFHRITIKNDIPELPKYDEILFSDRSGTIEGYSVFFDKLAPFDENMNELFNLLKNNRFLLCGISSGDHQEGFLSKNILKKLKESKISTNNILAFSQYHMASTIKNNELVQSNKVIMGFGDSTKEQCVKQFLNFLEQSKNLPNNLYAIGDHPLDDIPMLKLIHSQGGMVGFISPCSNKDKIIKAIKEWWLVGCKLKLLSYENEILRQKQYYEMVQNIDENWDWLKYNIMMKQSYF